VARGRARRGPGATLDTGMNAAPVIQRELRAQARQPLTHWLRAATVGLTLAAILSFALSHDFSPGSGAALLSYLHGWLSWAIWLFVPTLTADCLSRERREDTLSLLFLTNLRPLDIVLAKATAHAGRALMLWVAAVPALTLPFLIGGAGWQQAALFALLQLQALCLALGAGVLASSRCRAWARALVGALLTAGAFLIVVSVLEVLLFALVWDTYCAPPQGDRMLRELLDVQLLLAAIIMALWPGEGLEALSRASGAAEAWLLATGALTFLAAAFLGVCLGLAARNVNRHWRDEPPSPLAQWWAATFLTPVLGVRLLRRWLRRMLERNPVGWLERRTWSGRTLMWAWLAVVTSVYVTMFGGIRFAPLTAEGLQGLLAWSLAVSMAYTAAGSFRRERETGVLELLLVSPTSSWQILSGRVRALWGQFAPALALLLGMWLFLFTFPGERPAVGSLVFHAVVLGALPVIGLYFSLARRTFFAALLWTLAVGCVFPLILLTAIILPLGAYWDPTAGLLAGLLPGSPPSGRPLPLFIRLSPLVRVAQMRPPLFDVALLVAAAVHVANTVLYGVRLHRNLEQRKFALERGLA